MKNMNEFPIIEQVKKITYEMYRRGWNERNGGNISILLNEDDLKKYTNTQKVVREIPLTFDASELANRIFLVTSTGSYFKNIIENPTESLGIFRISPSGDKALVLWGFDNNNKFTSELPTHLMVHAARLKVDPSNQVVMHCHPLHILTMTHVHELTDKAFTLSLWRTMTESIVVFPEGLGVIPWMQSGTSEIGLATANKFMEYRLVVWDMHGILAVGQTIDDAYGLIDVAEKSADIYLSSSTHKLINNISNSQLKGIAEFYKVKHVKYEFLE